MEIKKKIEIEFQVLFLNLYKPEIPEWVPSNSINRIREMIEISGSYEGIAFFFLVPWSLAFYLSHGGVNCVLHSVSLSSPLRLFIFKINNTDPF